MNQKKTCLSYEKCIFWFFLPPFPISLLFQWYYLTELWQPVNDKCNITYLMCRPQKPVFYWQIFHTTIKRDLTSISNVTFYKGGIRALPLLWPTSGQFCEWHTSFSAYTPTWKQWDTFNASLPLNFLLFEGGYYDSVPSVCLIYRICFVHFLKRAMFDKFPFSLYPNLINLLVHTAFSQPVFSPFKYSGISGCTG